MTARWLALLIGMAFLAGCAGTPQPGPTETIYVTETVAPEDVTVPTFDSSAFEAQCLENVEVLRRQAQELYLQFQQLNMKSVEVGAGNSSSIDLMYQASEMLRQSQELEIQADELEASCY